MGEEWMVESEPTVTETALDFFAGSGLVTEGLRPSFETIWANDFCEKKRRVYEANFGSTHLDGSSISDVKGRSVPSARLAWASFPCQDLSLAGNMSGINKGTRSGLYWEWLRVLDEMGERRRPPILCVENVVGFLVADRGRQFARAYRALRERGYIAGAILIDAVHFVPQSRPRSFLIAVREGTPLFGSGLARAAPDGVYHAPSVMTAYRAVADDAWVWWNLPELPRRKANLADIIDLDASVDSPDSTERLIAMLSPINQRKLEVAKRCGRRIVGAGYKRVRVEGGRRVQRLEIRFDGVAGCLRTPEGGSSRQLVLIVKGDSVHTRLLTARETARLMGARESFWLPDSYNDAYRAMGDAVVVGVVRWLSRQLLSKLCQMHAGRPLQPIREAHVDALAI